MISKIKILLAIVLLSRLAFATALHYNGQWHGDEYNHESGARYFVGESSESYYEIVNLLQPKTADSYKRENEWIVDFVLHEGFLKTVVSVLTGQINFPLFYFFIGYFYKIFGYNPFIYRLFTSIISFLNIILAMKIVRFFNIDKKTITIFLVLAIFSPLLLQYSGTFYKEPIAQCGFYLIILAYLYKKYFVVLLIVPFIVLLRPSTFILTFIFILTYELFKQRSFTKMMLALLFLFLLFIPTDIQILGRDVFYMKKGLESTSLLSKIPNFDITFGLKLISLSIFMPISLLQPILFIYGYNTEFHYINLLWQLQSIEWIFILPLIIGAFLRIYRATNKDEYLWFVMTCFILFFTLSAYGVAGYESVRYRDILYPIVLLVSIKEINRHYYRFTATILLPVYLLGVGYGFLRLAGIM